MSKKDIDPIEIEASSIGVGTAITAIISSALLINLFYIDAYDLFNFFASGNIYKEQNIDVNVSSLIGFFSCVISLIFIPLSFTDSIIYSNMKNLRLLIRHGAQYSYITTRIYSKLFNIIFRSLVFSSIITAFFYLLFSEILQILGNVKQSYFIYDLLFNITWIFLFLLYVRFIVEVKVTRLYVRDPC